MEVGEIQVFTGGVELKHVGGDGFRNLPCALDRQEQPWVHAGEVLAPPFLRAQHERAQHARDRRPFSPSAESVSAKDSRPLPARISASALDAVYRSQSDSV